MTLPQLERVSFFLGNSLPALQDSRVAVIGLGGVGSSAVVSLCRTGVRYFYLQDQDVMDASALNRHACATLADVGILKTEVLRDFLPKINPGVDITISSTYCSAANMQDIFAWKPDFIITCFDNLPTLEDFVHECKQKDVKFIVSCGAACKSNPTCIRVGDLSEVTRCKMGRALRMRLAKRGITRGIMCAYSTEHIVAEPVKAEAPTEVTCNNNTASNELKFRRSKLPSMMGVPATFGQVLASWVIAQTCSLPFDCPPPFTGRQKLYSAIMTQTEKLGYSSVFHAVDPLILEELIEEIYMASSVVSKEQLKLAFVPWLPENGLDAGNMVLMTLKEAKNHVKFTNSSQFTYSKDLLSYVDGLLVKSRSVLAR
ncbi:hypothetical protein RCL1_000410 [Eukaryota sp. TZLM3-RCL]